MNKNKEKNKEEFLNDKSLLNQNEGLLEFALHYGSLGYKVIPLHNVVSVNGNLQCSCPQGSDCDNAGKHPRTIHGIKDASSELSEIREWWKRYPNANIGLRTGKSSELFVLDIDRRFNGKEAYDGERTIDFIVEFAGDFVSLDNLEPLQGTLTSISGSGSRHLYFAYPDGMRIRNSASLIGRGLDIKSDSNYIIAPPSNHLSGNKYKWFGSNIPILSPPNWLIYRILRTQRRPVANQRASDRKGVSFNDGNVKEGARNDYLFRQVSGLVRSFSKGEVFRRALKINENKFVVPLTNHEVAGIVDACWRRHGAQNGSTNQAKT